MLHTHIEELAENAVAVIGGQQAGILTGPLYSVHKAISVILLAKKQREKLGVPVVPVFWVAGEDHDLNEINHVYTEMEGRATKHQYRENFVLKLMASDAKYDKQVMASLVKDIFGKFGETAYTKDLLDEVLRCGGAGRVVYTVFCQTHERSFQRRRSIVHRFSIQTSYGSLKNPILFS